MLSTSPNAVQGPASNADTFDYTPNAGVAYKAGVNRLVYSMAPSSETSEASILM